MAEINIDPKAVEAVNSQLPAIISRVSEVSGVIANLRSSVNSNVLSQNNLRTRLKNAHNDISTMESDLRSLRKTINKIVDIYETNEQKQLGRVRNIKKKL